MSPKWLKRAFAIDPPVLREITPLQKEVVDRVCRGIVRRGLSTPALIFLETFRPLNYIGSQAMHYLRPIATAILEEESYRLFAEFLEHRGSVDYLCGRIEEYEALETRSGK